MSVAIRRLGPADSIDYRAIRLDALATAPEAFGSTYAAESARPLAAFAERLSQAVVFGAYMGDQIVGMAGYRRQDGLKDRHKGEVWGVYVAPRWRGQGVAGALMTAVIEAARGEVEQLLLAVVDGNDGALALYRRLGFEVYGVEPRALKTGNRYLDEALMVLFLER
ncbi:GNAT family N-acetyltransferase [Labrys okinawensis]|uniref:GNAT family N-acetyltransferase n=1 Tax=Labrys okinawensis TaxID=346911 RepID=A0A2S9Q9E8_9HYPH|nr:GNAT family N-acetyltransferase [Labrys okinawensis]PRH85976.1 GNAT family N-acetyltransferase [Labrys okinawensis]